MPPARRTSAPRTPLAFAPRPRRTAPEMERELREQLVVRSRLVLGVVAAFMVVLAGRAAWLMTVPNEYIEKQGKDLYQAPVEIRGQRGALLDREGRILAWTVNLPALYVNAHNFPQAEVDTRAPAIAALVGRSEGWVKERLHNVDSREFRLGGGLDPADAAQVLEGLNRTQLWLRNEPVRMYPGKESAAPLLGHVDSHGNGAAGLEKLLDDKLSGETQTVLQARDRKDRAIDAGVDRERLLRPGKSVRLSVDAAIQHAAEHALDEAMAVSRPEAAMAVVMDVRTGAILAMASRPAGNPNDGEARADQELFKNHTAMDQVEPGSVMKPFVVAAAIEEGLATPDMMVDCELGHWPVADKVIKDDHPKGVISVTEVIKYSSNIGTAKLGFKLGAEKMLSYLSDFGFARSTGLRLPGEVRGQMRSADNIRPIELATTAFGQGVTASPVQLVAAVAALANGGVRMHPYMVEAVLNRQGLPEQVFEPRVDRRIVSEETAHLVSRMMEAVTDDGGTGTRARVPGYRVAGKTGTAQKVENGGYSATKRVSSFVGFLPADHPVLAIAVVVDSPTVGSRYGGIVAAPVFAEIGSFSMRYLGVEPSEPAPTDDLVARASRGAEEEPVATPKPVTVPKPTLEALVKAGVAPVPTTPVELASDGAGGWILPDLRGRSMRAALESLAASGLALQVDGYGRLAEQSPAPGTRVAPGDRVVLRFN